MKSAGVDVFVDTGIPKFAAQGDLFEAVHIAGFHRGHHTAVYLLEVLLHRVKVLDWLGARRWIPGQPGTQEGEILDLERDRIASARPRLRQAACQGVGVARRNDEGLQKGGIPTLINALVNGEVAPIPAVRGTAIELQGSTLSGHSPAHEIETPAPPDFPGWRLYDGDVARRYRGWWSPRISRTLASEGSITRSLSSVSSCAGVS